MSKLEKSSTQLIYIYVNCLPIIYKFRFLSSVYTWFTQPWCYTGLLDFVEVLLGWFDRKIFRCQKHQLNANKYFSKYFFMNRYVKLYVIMLLFRKVKNHSTPPLRWSTFTQLLTCLLRDCCLSLFILLENNSLLVHHFTSAKWWLNKTDENVCPSIRPFTFIRPHSMKLGVCGCISVSWVI